VYTVDKGDNHETEGIDHFVLSSCKKYIILYQFV
jgi:hypothetical protein